MLSTTDETAASGVYNFEELTDVSQLIVFMHYPHCEKCISMAIAYKILIAIRMYDNSTTIISTIGPHISHTV